MKMTFRGRGTAVLTGLYIVISCVCWSCKKETSLSADKPTQSQPVPKDSIYISLSAVTQPASAKIGGYYVGLPSNYGQTTQAYPLLIYMHGAGQLGNGNSDLPLLLKDGVGQVINDKKFPGSFISNGKAFSFIVLLPQVNSFPGAGDIFDCIALAKKNWRIDSSRIYISGL